MEDNINDYSDEILEMEILGVCFRNKASFEWKQSLKKEHFTSDLSRMFYSFLSSSTVHYDSVEPWWRLLRIYVIPRVKSDEEINEIEQQFAEFWSSELEPNRETFDTLFGQLDAFLYGRAVFPMVRNAVEFFREGNPLEAKMVLEEAVSTSIARTRIIDRGDFLERAKFRIERYENDPPDNLFFPLGIDVIDDYISGLPKGALCFLEGRTNIGKTFFLQEIALRAVEDLSFKVLFVSVELMLDVLEVRWDSRISGSPIDRHLKGEFDSIELLKRKLKKFEKTYESGGRLSLVYMPEGVYTDDIETEVRFCEEGWGDSCDMVVIDYADLLSSRRRGYSEQERLGNLFRDLKRMAQRKKVILWTASQPSGSESAFKRGVESLSDIGYSKRKANWANFVLGAGQNRMEKERGLIWLKILKNTYGGTGLKVWLKPEFSRALIDSVDDDEEYLVDDDEFSER